MNIFSRVQGQGFRGVGRVARGLAPVLFIAAFVRCGADEADVDPLARTSQPAAPEVESRDVPADPELDEGEFGEGELGQVSEALVNGAPCAPGTTACLNGTTAQSCVNGRVVAATCPAGSLCSNGTCPARVCTPGSSRCAGNTVQICNGAGTGLVSAVCAAGSSCSNGRCIPVPPPQICTPGSLRCNGNTLLTCNGAGTALAFQDCGTGVCNSFQGCVFIR